MNGKNILAPLVLGFSLAASVFLSTPAGASGQVSQLSVESTYKSSSAEAVDVKQWLLRNTERMEGTPIGDFDALGDVRVTYTVSRSSSNDLQIANPGPPVPLPASGNEGDTITIDSTSGGIQQSWSYVWSGGDWQMIGYVYTVIR